MQLSVGQGETEAGEEGEDCSGDPAGGGGGGGAAGGLDLAGAAVRPGGGGGRGQPAVCQLLQPHLHCTSLLFTHQHCWL